MRQILLPLMLSVLMLTAQACESEESNNGNNQVRQVAVEVVTITPDSFDDFIRVSGSVEAINDAIISSEVNGRVEYIADRGQRVRKGDVIARIDDRIYRANVQAAKAAWEMAEETVDRLQPLYADSIVSVQDFRAARTERDAARAQLDQAEKNLEDTQIVAPFDGRVEERMIRTGELISPGMPVVRLVNTGRVRIRAGVPERFSGQISEGTPAELVLRAYGGERFESRVTYAGSVIDPDRRTFPVEIEMQNPDRLIKPEMVVNVRLKRATIENAVIIPRTAIIRDEGSLSVFVARSGENGPVAELVEVRTGTASGSVIEITEGLDEGDRVIVAGMSALSIGDRLNILSEESSTERARQLQRKDDPVITFD